MRRTFLAPPLTTTWPRVTWPSPPSATAAPRRTERMVVPWNCSIGDESPRCGPRPAKSSALARPRYERHQHAHHDYSADDHRAGWQIGDDGHHEPGCVAQRADQVRLEEPQMPGIERGQRRHDERGGNEE